MPYPQINTDQLKVYPLTQRKSKSKIHDIVIDPESEPQPVPACEPIITETAKRIIKAKESGASIMLAYGAHLVKNGAAPLMIKLMEKGWLTHVATQGAGTIHDWEFSYLGRSEEDVRANVATGTFGTWEETGKYINLAVQIGATKGMGYGESLGAFIHNDGMNVPTVEELKTTILNGLEQEKPDITAHVELLETIKKFNIPPGPLAITHKYKEFSILRNAFQYKVAATIHPGIGYDIIYNNPYANGAALGRGSHTDFKIFVKAVSNLTNGVFMSVGSAIMAPQVFEKALSYANNILLQSDQIVKNHYILVDDLQESVWDWTKGEPPKTSPDYYLRFLKSFNRMGGEIRYISADNRTLLHNLYWKLKEMTGVN